MRSKFKALVFSSSARVDSVSGLAFAEDLRASASSNVVAVCSKGERKGHRKVEREVEECISVLRG